MGQLFHLILLPVTVGLISLLLMNNPVNARNCDFPDANVTYKESGPEGDLWIIYGDPVSEKLIPDDTVWDNKTENVTTASASPYPHAKYLTGYRYPTRYVYKASTSFPDFVNEENSVEIQRNVTYTCEDGDTLRIHFRFPLIDVNDPPYFALIPNELTASLTGGGYVNPNGSILVKDKDFNDTFNSVTVMTDRPDLLIIEPEPECDCMTMDCCSGLGKEFYVNLKLNETGAKPGRYSLNLFCSDGMAMNSSSLVVNIVQ